MYQIRKGWPSNGAIDEIFEAAPSVVLKEGVIVTLKDHVATINGDGIPCFVIGQEPARKTWTGLLSECVIECDNEHYSGTPVAGDYVWYDEDGKFAVGTKDQCVGRVLAADVVKNTIRVLWF